MSHHNSCSLFNKTVASDQRQDCDKFILVHFCLDTRHQSWSQNYEIILIACFQLYMFTIFRFLVSEFKFKEFPCLPLGLHGERLISIAPLTQFTLFLFQSRLSSVFHSLRDIPNSIFTQIPSPQLLPVAWQLRGSRICFPYFRASRIFGCLKSNSLFSVPQA